MPQDSIYSHLNPDLGLRTTWEAHEGGAGLVWNLVIEIKSQQGGWRTVQAQRWTGYMLDIASLLASETTTAFFFGDERDTSRAAASVAKTARAHQRHSELNRF